MYVKSNLDLDGAPTWFSLGNPIAKPAGPMDAATVESNPSSAFGNVGESLRGQQTPATQPVSADGTSRAAAIQLGSPGNLSDYQITLVSTLPLANDVVAQTNQFNELPSPGKQFYIARVAVTYTGATSGNPAWDLNFQAVGDLNASYTTFNNDCGVYPEQQFEQTELFSGGSSEFNVCWEIDSADQDSLVMYVESNVDFNATPVWFSLN